MAEGYVTRMGLDEDGEVIGYEFIQIGFGQLSFTIAAFTSDVYKVIEAGILVLFLIYLNNEGIITDILTMRRYRQHIPKKETST